MQSRFALVDGERREARPGLSGKCPICGAPMIAKCGEVRVHHWAHHVHHECDHWWEPETEWHRRWKDQFPQEWQEVIQTAPDGSRHIADVKTAHGLVIEFQHSHIRPEERRAREAFYGRMVWLVNGLRLKRDQQKFYDALRPLRTPVQLDPLTYRISVDDCALLRRWASSRASVVFDFGYVPRDVVEFGEPVLWRLAGVTPAGICCLRPVRRASLIKALNDGTRCPEIRVATPRGPLMLTGRRQSKSRMRAGPISFQVYLARKRRRQPRF